MTITKKAAVPLRVQETPVWFYKFGRLLIALFLLAVSVSYDISVAEVSGDARWVLTHWTATILVVAYFLACLNRRQNVITFRAPPIIWLVVFLIVLSSLSMVWTMSPYHSWWSLKHFLGYTAMFGFIYLLRHEKWYTNLLWVVAFGVGFNCLIGITQFHNITDAGVSAVFPPWNYVTAGFAALLRAVHFSDGMDKPIAGTLPFFQRNLFLDYFCQTAPPAGTQANKNLFGSYLVLTLPAIFYLLLSSRKRLARLAATVLFAMGMITLFYTRSRASWISALCAAIFFVSWLLLHQQYRQIIKTFFTTTILIMLAVVCLVAIGGISLQGKLGVRSVIEQVRSLVQMNKQTDNDTLGIRIAYDLNGLAMIKDRPFHGVGLGAFHTAYPAYYQAICPTPPGGFSVGARPSRMHNDLEQAFVELGIFGGLAYLGVFLTLLMMTWRIGNNAITYETRLLSLCLMTGIVGLGINSLMDFPLQLPLAPTLLWSFAGMLTGLYVIYVEKTDVGPQKKKFPHRLIYILLTIAAVAGGWAVFKDDWSRRKGDQYLKVAIALASSGRFDEQTLLYLRKSIAYYTWNVRLQEYRALIYPSYTGRTIPVSVDDKIREVEAAIKYDPYSPNKLVNLGGLYIIRSQELAAENRVAEALKYACQAEDLFKIMLKYPGFFSDLTYTIGGMAHMLQGILQPSDARSHLNQAYVLLEKALEFNPNYGAACGALKQTQVALTHFTGQPIPDCAGGAAPTNVPLRNAGTVP
ncbi:MAG: O-antigen ligase family protein [Kiritimatiellaeota bacterium]|nr:O-antigen ligase family protein [Kiritimatiellota bacterium]